MVSTVVVVAMARRLARVVAHTEVPVLVQALARVVQPLRIMVMALAVRRTALAVPQLQVRVAEPPMARVAVRARLAEQHPQAVVAPAPQFVA